MDYLLIFLADVFLAVSFGLTKVYQNIAGDSNRALIFRQVVGALFSAVLFFFVNGCKFEFSWFSFLMCIAFTVFCGVYSILGYKIMSYGKYALYMLFLMLGGMTLPYIYGLIFLNERPSAFGYIGIVLIIASLILSTDNKKTEGQKYNPVVLILLCVGVFFLNGFTSISVKVHQNGGFTAATAETFEHISSNALTVIQSILSPLMFFGFYPFMVKPGEPKVLDGNKKRTALLFAIIFGAGAIGALSGVLQFNGALTIPATALYPMITGGSIVLNSLVSAIFFHEKYSKKFWIGTALCCVATVLFIWS